MSNMQAKSGLAIIAQEVSFAAGQTRPAIIGHQQDWLNKPDYR
jgi:hypothetical protein